MRLQTLILSPRFSALNTLLCLRPVKTARRSRNNPPRFRPKRSLCSALQRKPTPKRSQRTSKMYLLRSKSENEPCPCHKIHLAAESFPQRLDMQTIDPILKDRRWYSQIGRAHV